MVINDIPFNCELLEIVNELQSQLNANGIKLMHKVIDTPDNVMVCCPYHKEGQERKPSAGIRKSDGLFHCFACGEIHSLQEMISFCFGHYDDLVGSFGWKWLTRNFLMMEVEERALIPLNLSRNKRKDKSNKITLPLEKNVLERELKRFRYIHPYILKRGVSEKIVELFDIGWDSKLDAITFPNLDKNGNCLFVARRSVKTKFFQYPKNVQKELYGIYQLYQLNPFPSEVYVCESMIDCLYLWTFDMPACAMNGLGNEIQFKQLRELPCRQIVLATDSDEAGQSARQRIRMNMQNTKIIKEVVLPKGRKDINECSATEIQNLVTIF